MADVFVSYSHRDGHYAHSLAAELRSQGLDVWIDDRIDYGDQWPRVIQDNLAACRVFIVVMSTQAFNSMWVQNEVSYAQASHKIIFPLLLEGSVWLSLAAMQYVDVRDGSMPPSKFAERVRSALNQPPLTPPKVQVDTGGRTKPRRNARWAWVSGSVLFFGAAAFVIYMLLGGPPFGQTATPTDVTDQPTVLPTQPPATQPPPTEPPTTEPPPTEAPATEPPPTEAPVSGDFTSKDFHLQVGDVRTYKYGLATEGTGESGISQELGEVVERVVALEEGSNAVMEIFRVERRGDMVALDCGTDAGNDQVKTLWYIRDASRIFTACSDQQKAMIVDGLVKERLFSGSSLPEIATPSYIFPMVVNARWSRWADIPASENAFKDIWIVDSQSDEKTTFAGTFHNCFAVTLRTNPDVTVRNICQGMGLVSWFYRHNGTLTDYTGELWSYEFAP